MRVNFGFFFLSRVLYFSRLGAILSTSFLLQVLGLSTLLHTLRGKSPPLSLSAFPTDCSLVNTILIVPTDKFCGVLDFDSEELLMVPPTLLKANSNSAQILKRVLLEVVIEMTVKVRTIHPACSDGCVCLRSKVKQTFLRPRSWTTPSTTNFLFFKLESVELP